MLVYGVACLGQIEHGKKTTTDEVVLTVAFGLLHGVVPQFHELVDTAQAADHRGGERDHRQCVAAGAVDFEGKLVWPLLYLSLFARTHVCVMADATVALPVFTIGITSAEFRDRPKLVARTAALGAV